MLYEITIYKDVERVSRATGEVESYETQFDFTVDYYPGSREYFCFSFGNWLPGEDKDITVISVRMDGEEVHSEAHIERIVEYVGLDTIAEALPLDAA